MPNTSEPRVERALIVAIWRQIGQLKKAFPASKVLV
jgi:hypothetical protein